MIKNLLMIFVISFILLQCKHKEFYFHTTNGNAITVDSFRRKWLILVYWASWCDSCQQEVAELNKFYQSYANDSVLMYGVNYDNLSGDRLMAEMLKMKFLFPTLVESPVGYFNVKKPNILPAIFIVNPQLNLQAKLFGPISAENLSNKLNNIKSNYKE